MLLGLVKFCLFVARIRDHNVSAPLTVHQGSIADGSIRKNEGLSGPMKAAFLRTCVCEETLLDSRYLCQRELYRKLQSLNCPFHVRKNSCVSVSFHSDTEVRIYDPHFDQNRSNSLLGVRGHMFVDVVL